MTETFKKDPLETGGILLGHILDNGIWLVMEVLPPGWRSTFQYAYFEYDEQFVNYVAENESKKYEQELSLLGLWHRHPGSMDTFSGTDDGTNRTFGSLHPKGAISGLVNIDPRFRLTMYHCSIPLRYTKVDVEVGDDLIPEGYFKLKYYEEGKELNPMPPQKKNEKTSSERQYEIAPESRNNPNNPPTGNNIIMELMKIFNSKYLFLLLFIVGAALSLFSFYSYNKLKSTDDIKSLYRIYYTEHAVTPTSDTIEFVRNEASDDFDEQQPSIKEKLNYENLLLAQNQDKLNARIKGITGDSVNLLTEQFKDTLLAKDKVQLDVFIGKFLIKSNIKKEDANIDSLTAAYKEPLLAQELSRLKQKCISKAEQDFRNEFQKSHELTSDTAKIGIKIVVLLLLIASLLSLLSAFLPRKHKPFVEWLTIGVSVVIAFLIAKLIYPLLAAFIVVLFFVFVFLCFIAFIVIFILKSFNFKKKTKGKSSGFWFQQNQKLYIEEEAEIRKRFADAEKNVENGVVSFFIKTYKQIDNQNNNLAFQLVYSADYLNSKEVKVYLLSPDLDEMLAKTKELPNVEIDSAGESYLALSKTIEKEKVSGMEVIRKLYEWLQLNIQ
jgi:hypothetical protein